MMVQSETGSCSTVYPTDSSEHYITINDYDDFENLFRGDPYYPRYPAVDSHYPYSIEEDPSEIEEDPDYVEYTPRTPLAELDLDVVEYIPSSPPSEFIECYPLNFSSPDNWGEWSTVETTWREIDYFLWYEGK